MIVSVVASVHYKWQPMKVLKQVHFYQSLVLLWGQRLLLLLFPLIFSFILCSLHSCSGTVVRWNRRSCNISGRNELYYLYALPQGASGHQLWPHFLPQLSLWKLSGESQDLDHTCPLCQAPVQPRTLCPNWQLASVVDEVRLVRFWMEMGLKTDVCDLH